MIQGKLQRNCSSNLVFLRKLLLLIDRKEKQGKEFNAGINLLKNLILKKGRGAGGLRSLRHPVLCEAGQVPTRTISLP